MRKRKKKRWVQIIHKYKTKQKISIAYIKKHVYKERKETTHVKIGEETYIIILYMRKDKYNVCQ